MRDREYNTFLPLVGGSFSGVGGSAGLERFLEIALNLVNGNGVRFLTLILEEIMVNIALFLEVEKLAQKWFNEFLRHFRIFEKKYILLILILCFHTQ
jgi:hypothetical protein